MKIRLTLILALLFSFSIQAETLISSHGFSVLKDPLKYPADFKQFDYVNPDAPQGGTIRLHAIGSFDNLNPFILKGRPAASASLPFESLMTSAADEIEAFYGFIAERVEYPEDFSFLRFYMRKDARWHDGQSLTAHDVQFSYQTLLKKGPPGYRVLLKEIEQVKVIDDYTVEFSFANLENRDLPGLVATMPILPQHYYAEREFEKTTLEPPLGSGPYKVSYVKAGHAIHFERVNNYWGNDLPANRGLFNFDKIEIDYYRDRQIAFEAFKSGEYDARQELVSKTWSTQYNFPAINDGKVIKESYKNHLPAGIQAFFFNTRKAQFQDRRVRQALTLVYDFEWLNKNTFFNQYQRSNSLFENTDMAANHPPSPEELVVLKELNQLEQLPQEAFTQPYSLPKNRGDGNIRQHLRTAKKLLQEAGWTVKDGQLVNQNNEPFEIEFLVVETTFSRFIQPYIKNLERLGIKGKIRNVDTAQFQQRLDNYDFDMVSVRYGQSLTPGLEQRRYWESQFADIPGNPNLSGVKNKAVDTLINKLIKAESRDEIILYAKVLDRIIMWEFYFIPAWFSPSLNIAYWDKFGIPKPLPPYATMMGSSNGDPVANAHLWWFDKDKAKRLINN